MAKFLDLAGVEYLWGKIVDKFVAKETGKTLSSNDFTTALKTKLDGLSNYTHPSHTAKTSGLYKLTVDSLGHVSAATAVTKADITALGIPAQDTNTTYGPATASADGLFTSDKFTKLEGIAAGAQVNVIEKISVNGSAQTVTSKGVNLTVPTKTSQITNDSKFQTDAQVTSAINSAVTSITNAEIDSILAA